MRRPVVITAATALAFVFLAVVLFKSPLTDKHTRIASVGTPNPVNTESQVRLKAGSRLCLTRTLLSPRTEIAELVVMQGDAPTPPLEVVAEGPGYRSPVARIPASEPGRHPVTARIQPPDRELIGQLCVRAAERKPVTFVGTVEFRTITRSIGTIDGTPIGEDVALKFYTEERVSALSELGNIVDRMTISRGFLGAAWVVWALIVLVAVGVPAAVLAALHRSLSGPGPDPR